MSYRKISYIFYKLFFILFAVFISFQAQLTFAQKDKEIGKNSKQEESFQGVITKITIRYSAGTLNWAEKKIIMVPEKLVLELSNNFSNNFIIDILDILKMRELSDLRKKYDTPEFRVSEIIDKIKEKKVSIKCESKRMTTSKEQGKVLVREEYLIKHIRFIK
ncbi:MAG: hypothetical protein M0P73_13050 [Syntrophobacterales bacterium]|jgi:hypothetical protein|nr:hypothetical protein [Syntrophobacterales bacterium]